MRSELYQRIFPNTRIAKDTELEIGALTGRGGSIIILDDPLKPQEAMSEAAREMSGSGTHTH